MEKLKILYTIPNFDTAGSGKVVYDLVKGLDKDLFEVEIACNHNKGAFFKAVEALGVSIHIVKTTVPYRPYLSLFFRLRSIIRFFKNQKYDIVHSWDWSSDWTEALAARLAGVTWLYTKKAMSWGNKHWKIRSYLAHFIVTINDDMQGYFTYKKQQRLIPLGIDTHYYNPESFKTQADTRTTFDIITVANLVPVKGIEVLIQAIQELAQPNIRLIILGDDTNAYAATLKAQINAAGLESQINFLGKHPDVRPFFASADLYVIPTLERGEGMPMALVEAMSMGVPVLGSDVAGINFVLKDFPELLFQPRCEKDLVKKIKMVMDNSKALNKELGEKLRLYCEEHFSYQKFIEAHQELYKSLIR